MKFVSAYFAKPAINSDIDLISASFAPMPFGGIAPSFQPNEPPLVILAAILLTASLSPLNFAEISINDGPTPFLSTEWHAPHLALPPAGKSTASAEPAIIRLAVATMLTIIDFMISPWNKVLSLFTRRVF